MCLAVGAPTGSDEIEKRIAWVHEVRAMASSLQPVPITSQKHDPAWKHVQMFKDGEKVQLKCIYCGKLFKGGGIHRIKEHLAGQKGNASTCLRTPADVRMLMQKSLDGAVAKKRRKLKNGEEVTTTTNPLSGGIQTPYSDQDGLSSGVQLIANPVVVEPCSSLIVDHDRGDSFIRNVERKKRGRPSKGSLALAKATAELVPAANGFDSVVQKTSNVHVAIAQFIYDAGVPLDSVNSIYFRPMLDAIASQGITGFAPPSYHDLRGCVLKSLLEGVRAQADHYERTWARTGCSVLVEEWSTDKGKVLVNFLASCPAGAIFLKSADITTMIHSPDAIFEMLKEVVEEVGVTNVLQVITANEDRYAIAGRKLCEVYPTMYWVPCAASSIHLMLQDFGEIEWIKAALDQSKAITRFVYNHSAVLNMVRRYTYGMDLVVPCATRSATNFSSLKRMVELRHNLLALISSQEWVDSLYSKMEGGLVMLDYTSDDSFWSSCSMIVRLMDPLLQILRLVRSEKRRAMGYLYAGIYRAKETIKKELGKRESYLDYWNVIDHRWEENRHVPLLAAGFHLNPKFFYVIEGDLPSDIGSGMFDCIERLVPDTKVQDKISKELNSYKNAVGDFGRNMAIRARDALLPAEWWSTYGGGCPNLSRLAIRIFSQRCSLMHCKRDLIPFEQLHDSKNSLEHQWLKDLVFTQYNLRLRQLSQRSEEPDNLDPISFDVCESVEEWIMSSDFGSSDWTAIDPPSSDAMLLKPSGDDIEELGDGRFDDYEIFGAAKDEENI